MELKSIERNAMTKTEKQKFVAAKTEVDALIRKHGFAAVRWVVNRRGEELRLRRKLDAEKKRLGKEIAELNEKMKRL